MLMFGLKGVMSRYLLYIILEKLEIFSYQLNSKIKIQPSYPNCFVSAVSKNGKDGHGLKFEKAVPAKSKRVIMVGVI